MRKYLLFLFAIITAVALIACSTGEDAGEDPKDEGTNATEGTDGEDSGGEKMLCVNNGDEPKSLDPSIGFDNISWAPLNNLMEDLTRRNAASVADEGVAEYWDISDDGL